MDAARSCFLKNAAAVLLCCAACYGADFQVPSNIAVTQRTETSITLSWSQTEDGASYTVYYTDDSEKADSVLRMKSAGITTATIYTVAGLEPGTDYYFRITCRTGRSELIVTSTLGERRAQAAAAQGGVLFDRLWEFVPSLGGNLGPDRSSLTGQLSLRSGGARHSFCSADVMFDKYDVFMAGSACVSTLYWLPAVFYGGIGAGCSVAYSGQNPVCFSMPLSAGIELFSVFDLKYMCIFNMKDTGTESRHVLQLGLVFHQWN